MPDFSPPTDDELAAERQAAERARALAADPTAASRAQLGLEPSDTAPESPGARTPSARVRRHARIRPALDRLDAPRRRLRRLARHPLVAFAAGAGLVGSVLVGGPALLSTGAAAGSAQQLQLVVDDYVDALASGDVAAALALHEPDGDAASLALLAAGVAPTTPPTIACTTPTVSERDPDVASARCDVAVPGHSVLGESQQLRLERVGGSWRIVAGLAERVSLWTWLIDVASVGGTAVDGADLEAPSWLLPGAYAVGTVAPELVEVEGSGTLAVGGGTGGWLDAWPQPSQALLDEVAAFGTAWALDCLAGEGTGAACDALLPATSQAEVSATPSGEVMPSEDGSLIVALLVEGTGSPLRPRVEVEVRFSDAGAIDAVTMREGGAP